MAEATKDTREKKPGFFARLKKSIRDMRGETRKVVWPTKKQTLHNTVVVLTFMLIMAVFIGALDTALSAIIRLGVGA